MGKDGGGKAERSAADDGNVGLGRIASGEGELKGHGSRAPGERPARAAVAVVMHDELVADTLSLDARTLGAERTGADGNFKEAIFVGANGGQWRNGVVEGQGGDARGADRRTRTSRRKTERGNGSRGLKEVTPVHKSSHYY